MNEFTHGKQENVSKVEFKEVLSDILLGMAAGLKRDPIVILRIDGEDLLEYINGPSFEPEMVAAYSLIESAAGNLQDCIIKAFELITVEQGMPPSSDPWVVNHLQFYITNSSIISREKINYVRSDAEFINERDG